MLNEFDGLTTIGSCGGHPNPTIYQEPEGSWSIIMKFDHGNDGWLALEFLSWLINHDAAMQENAFCSIQPRDHPI